MFGWRGMEGEERRGVLIVYSNHLSLYSPLLSSLHFPLFQTYPKSLFLILKTRGKNK
jgi:1-acyl-sn-glycerol-3-phosphate acyltransferase